MADIIENKNRRLMIAYLEFVIDAEVNKPLGEMNIDAVNSNVSVLLDIQGKNEELSPEHIKEKVRKLFSTDVKQFSETAVEKPKKAAKTKRILLIAAIISILVALFSLASIAFEWDIFNEMKERFGSIINVPIGVEQQENGISFRRYEQGHIYEDAESFFAKENKDVLLPVQMPEGITVENIEIYQRNGSEVISISFEGCGYGCIIDLNTQIPDEVIYGNTEIMEINGLKCYIEELNDVNLVQIYFSHNGNAYSYMHNDKQVLLEIIENLENKNEN